ncbi:MAG TPA: hypothetical protein PKB03_05415 [Baekduia sp.]|nr:hypothetical protein [Baekduia sp.]
MSVLSWASPSLSRSRSGIFVLLAAVVLLAGFAPSASAEDDVMMSQHSCVVKSGGTVWCWGLNDHGQIGNAAAEAVAPAPVQVDGITNAVDVSTRGASSCALLENHTVKCWGDNGANQIGSSTGATSVTPVVLDDLTDAEAVSVGVSQICVIRAAGVVRCSGFGAPSPTELETPGVVQVSVGATHTCAVFADGGVKCAGMNTFGQLGDGTTELRTTLVPVSGLTDAVQVGAGYYHSCALRSGGTVTCWGYGGYGFMGDGTTDDHLTPHDVPGLTGVVRLYVGLTQTCAITNTGATYCWAWDFSADPGEEPSALRFSPTLQSGVSNAVTVFGGFFHSCAVLASATVSCWGQNANHQLGDGTDAGLSLSAVQLPSLSGVLAPRAGHIAGGEDQGDGGDSDDSPPVDPGVTDTPADTGDPEDDDTTPTVLSPKTTKPVVPTVRLTGARLAFSKFVVKVKGKGCPATVRITVTIPGNKRAQTARLKVRRSGTKCILTSTLQLPAKAKSAKTVKVRFSGAKVSTRTVTAKRSA